MEIGWADMRFSLAWSQRRQARVEAILGQASYEDLLSVVVWLVGGRVVDSQQVWGVQRSRFYERLEQMLEGMAHRSQRVEGEQAGLPLSPAMIGRVVEIVVAQPGLTVEEIATELKAQDGSQVTAEAIQAYLTRAGLAGYQASGFMQALPSRTLASSDFGERSAELTRSLSRAVEPSVESQSNEAAGLGHYTRYAVSALNVPMLEQLGYRAAVAKLDVTGARVVYPHQLQCDVLVWGYWYGKARVFQTGELVPDEMAEVLGVARYPKPSELHDHLGQIVRQDQVQAEAQVPGWRRLIAGFTRAARQLLALAGGPGVGQAIYLDTHILKLYPAAEIDRTKNAAMAQPVKAILKLRAVSAKRPGRPLLFTYEQAATAFTALLDGAIQAVEQATGEGVEMIGADRGALSWEVLDAFEGGPRGFVVWADDTPMVRETAAALPLSKFVDAEYETVRQADGRQVQQVKTKVANVSSLVVNAEGKRYRAVVVLDVRTEHRSVLFAVGQPGRGKPAKALLEFMRGKQWVEEDFKQGKRQGADAFCGGEIVPQLRRQPPTPAEVEQVQTKLVKLQQRLQANQAEEQAAQARYADKQIGKRQLNDVLKGIRRRRERIVADQREAQEVLEWAQTGQTPPSQIRWVVDTRKMMVLSQLHEFARLAQRDTIEAIKTCVLEVLIEREIARRPPPVSAADRRAIQTEMQRVTARMPWGQLTRRILDQGGWIKRDPTTRVMTVTIKAFDHPVIQAAMQRLCERWNQKAATMPAEDGVYTLQFVCQSAPDPPEKVSGR